MNEQTGRPGQRHRPPTTTVAPRPSHPPDLPTQPGHWNGLTPSDLPFLPHLERPTGTPRRHRNARQHRLPPTGGVGPDPPRTGGQGLLPLRGLLGPPLGLLPASAGLALARDVLAMMAGGRSNAAIAQRLHFSEGAVSNHTSTIFAKLGLGASDDDNRRVLAVLAYPDGTRPA
ncbi:regulatory protein, luxR family [Streptomyces sp. 1331.2]|nr:regulatory protein, luxR family [Streptomyces sp. 1331.2]